MRRVGIFECFMCRVNFAEILCTLQLFLIKILKAGKLSLISIPVGWDFYTKMLVQRAVHTTQQIKRAKQTNQIIKLNVSIKEDGVLEILSPNQ